MTPITIILFAYTGITMGAMPEMALYKSLLITLREHLL
jgi:hypothetical protein